MKTLCLFWPYVFIGHSCLFHMFWPLIRNLNIPPFNQLYQQLLNQVLVPRCHQFTQFLPHPAIFRTSAMVSKPVSGPTPSMALVVPDERWTWDNFLSKSVVTCDNLSRWITWVAGAGYKLLSKPPLIVDFHVFFAVVWNYIMVFPMFPFAYDLGGWAGMSKSIEMGISTGTSINISAKEMDVPAIFLCRKRGEKQPKK